MSRLGITPHQFYWDFTPAEFHYALEDYRHVSQSPLQLVCETIREVAVTIHNSAFGRKKKDIISDPKKLITFGWEKDDDKPQIQSAEEIKAALMGLTHLGISVTKQNKQEDNEG